MRPAAQSFQPHLSEDLGGSVWLVPSQFHAPRAYLFLIQSLEGRQGPSHCRRVSLKHPGKVATIAETWTVD